MPAVVNAGQTAASTPQVVERFTHVVREQSVLNASMDTLTVKTLRVESHLAVPDVTLFYPPHPETLASSFLNFDTPSRNVEFRTGGNAFFCYNSDTDAGYIKALHAEQLETAVARTNTLRATKIETTDLVLPYLHVPHLRTERLETPAMEIGGIVLREGTAMIPRDAYVGSSLTVPRATIGSAHLDEHGLSVPSLRALETISCGQLTAERIVTSAPTLTLGGVTLDHGDVHARNLEFQGATGSTLVTDTLQSVVAMTSDLRVGTQRVSCKDAEDAIAVSGGLIVPGPSRIGPLSVTPREATLVGAFHASSVECEVGSIQRLHVGAEGASIAGPACVAGVSLSNDTVSASRAKFSSLQSEEAATTILSSATVNASNVTCTHVGANQVVTNSIVSKDYRLPDGTSILNGIFPAGMIMLYAGTTPPRGWLVCNGTGGTPSIPSPAAGVIYIVRR